MDRARGGLNGDVVNAYQVNGGGWTLSVSAPAGALLDGAARLSQRHGMSATLPISLSGLAGTTARRGISATATVAVAGEAMARRRAVIAGAGGIMVDSVLDATRRRTLRGASSIAITAHAALFWRHRQRAARERGYLVPLERQSPAITRSSR